MRRPSTTRVSPSTSTGRPSRPAELSKREQLGEGLRVGEVVDGDDLEVGVALEQGAKHIASDAAESVDGDASHEGDSFRSGIPSPADGCRDSGRDDSVRKDHATPWDIRSCSTPVMKPPIA